MLGGGGSKGFGAQPAYEVFAPLAPLPSSRSLAEGNRIFRCGSLCCCVGDCVVGHCHLYPLHSWQDILLTFAEMELDSTTMFPPGTSVMFIRSTGEPFLAQVVGHSEHGDAHRRITYDHDGKTVLHDRASVRRLSLPCAPSPLRVYGGGAVPRGGGGGVSLGDRPPGGGGGPSSLGWGTTRGGGTKAVIFRSLGSLPRNSTSRTFSWTKAQMGAFPWCLGMDAPPSQLLVMAAPHLEAASDQMDILPWCLGMDASPTSAAGIGCPPPRGKRGPPKDTLVHNTASLSSGNSASPTTATAAKTHTQNTTDHTNCTIW